MNNPPLERFVMQLCNTPEDFYMFLSVFQILHKYGWRLSLKRSRHVNLLIFIKGTFYAQLRRCQNSSRPTVFISHFLILQSLQKNSTKK